MNCHEGGKRLVSVYKWKRGIGLEFWKSTSYLVWVAAALCLVGVYLLVRAGAAVGDGCIIPGSVDHFSSTLGLGVILGGLWASYNAGRADEKTRPR